MEKSRLKQKSRDRGLACRLGELKKNSLHHRPESLSNVFLSKLHYFDPPT